jgi:hypothetical protein
MKTTLKLMAILLAACAGAQAQVVPEASAGPANLDYALRYSVFADIYSDLPTTWDSSISGDVNYSNGFEHHPFNLDYGGGYTWTLAGPPIETGIFQRLLISDGYIGERWNLVVSDNIEFLPEAPTVGFSGVAGTGDVGTPGSNPPSGQSILTVNTRSLSNTASTQMGYHINYPTTLSVGANYSFLHFPDGNGQNSGSLSGNAALTRRIDARNSISGQYVYSHYTLGSSAFAGSTTNSSVAFNTNAGLIGLQRHWTRKLTTTSSIGPQWLSSSNATDVPSSTGFAANAAAAYQLPFGAASLGYSHGVNGGGGYLPGATTDSVYGGLSREFERDLTIGITGSYSRTAALQSTYGVADSTFGGAQASWRLSRTLNVFGNYTAINQSSNLAINQSSSSSPQTNILSGFYQVIGFGIAYSPRQSHLRR